MIPLQEGHLEVTHVKNENFWTPLTDNTSIKKCFRLIYPVLMPINISTILCMFVHFYIGVLKVTSNKLFWYLVVSFFTNIDTTSINILAILFLWS